MTLSYEWRVYCTVCENIMDRLWNDRSTRPVPECDECGSPNIWPRKVFVISSDSGLPR